ncbi:MFS transporter [Oceanobacillus halophilus]|uniref:MFS transporter n=1 Tax=Oceanobacillus halophilus TaxID=930130 RepID=A0A495A154_9BACI|nr:MFS transporter [Oceanobacillus halophilus]RKQ33200.1 MFS transporter [Oceanobacillus halophilus]
MENPINVRGRQNNYSLITFLLFCCALFVVSSVYVATPLMETFSTAFQVTPNMAAWTSSIFSICYGIGFLLFGPLSDMYGRKEMIVFGLIILSVITVLIGFTNHFYILLILRGLQGFFAATFAPSALSYVFEVFPKNKVATTIGFISFGFVTSGIFGQVAGDAINQTFDWNVVFLFFGCLYGMSMLAVWWILPKKKLQEKTNVREYLLKVKFIVTNKNLMLCYLITVMLLLTFIGMYTVLGGFLGNAPFHLSEKQILGIRAMGIIGMVFSPITGIWIRRYGVLRILKIGLSVSVIGLIVLGFTTNLALLITMSIIYVAGISITFPSIMMLVGNLGGKYRAIASSFYTFILFIGATLGPIISLNIMKWGNFMLTMEVLALLLAIGLTGSFFIKIKDKSSANNV